MKDYVIGVGLKGQNVVLKEINAIKKAGAKLAKNKITANVVAKVSATTAAGATAAGAAASKNATPKFDAKQYISQAKEAGAKARDVLGQTMTSGVSGIASSLPGIGALFSASQSAVGSAAQDYVAGITASKNIQLITSNFQKAFGNALDGAFKNSMFANRQNKAVYANLAEQGVNVSTLAKKENVGALETFARAQGVGSLEELFQRAQSGQLKENAGFSKGDIEYAKNLTGLLNNRYTADIGYQSFINLIKSRKAGVGAVAGTKNMQNLAYAVRAEGNIQETEQNYQAGAAATLGRKGYDAMLSTRLADLKLRARTVGTAAKIEAVKTEIGNQLADLGDDIEKGDWLAVGRRFAPGYIDPRAAKRQGIKTPGAAEGAAEGGGEAMPEGGSSGGAAPLSNADLTRAGAALADTLNQINSQLRAVQNQFRTRGA